MDTCNQKFLKQHWHHFQLIRNHFVARWAPFLAKDET